MGSMVPEQDEPVVTVVMAHQDGGSGSEQQAKPQGYQQPRNDYCAGGSALPYGAPPPPFYQYGQPLPPQYGAPPLPGYPGYAPYGAPPPPTGYPNPYGDPYNPYGYPVGGPPPNPYGAPPPQYGQPYRQPSPPQGSQPMTFKLVLNQPAAKTQAPPAPPPQVTFTHLPDCASKITGFCLCPKDQPPTPSSKAPANGRSIASTIADEVWEKMQKQDKPKSVSKGPVEVTPDGAFGLSKKTPHKGFPQMAPLNGDGLNEPGAMLSIPDLDGIIDPKYAEYYKKLSAEKEAQEAQMSRSTVGGSTLSGAKNSSAYRKPATPDNATTVSGIFDSTSYKTSKTSTNSSKVTTGSGTSKVKSAKPTFGSKSKPRSRSSSSRNGTTSSKSSEIDYSKSLKVDASTASSSNKKSKVPASKLDKIKAENSKSTKVNNKQLQDSTFFALPSSTSDVNGSQGEARESTGECSPSSMDPLDRPLPSEKVTSSIVGDQSYSKAAKSSKPSSNVNNNRPRSATQSVRSNKGSIKPELRGSTSLSNPDSKKSNEKDKRECGEDLSSVLDPDDMKDQKNQKKMEMGQKEKKVKQEEDDKTNTNSSKVNTGSGTSKVKSAKPTTFGPKSKPRSRSSSSSGGTTYMSGMVLYLWILGGLFPLARAIDTTNDGIEISKQMPEWILDNSTASTKSGRGSPLLGNSSISLFAIIMIVMIILIGVVMCVCVVYKKKSKREKKSRTATPTATPTRTTKGPRAETKPKVKSKTHTTSNKTQTSTPTRTEVKTVTPLMVQDKLERLALKMNEIDVLLGKYFQNNNKSKACELNSKIVETSKLLKELNKCEEQKSEKLSEMNTTFVGIISKYRTDLRAVQRTEAHTQLVGQPRVYPNGTATQSQEPDSLEPDWLDEFISSLEETTDDDDDDGSKGKK